MTSFFAEISCRMRSISAKPIVINNILNRHYVGKYIFAWEWLLSPSDCWRLSPTGRYFLKWPPTKEFTTIFSLFSGNLFKLRNTWISVFYFHRSIIKNCNTLFCSICLFFIYFLWFYSFIECQMAFSHISNWHF